MKEELTIAQHRVVTMQYSLSNTDGVVIREASSEPITYLHGVGALPSRLEQELENHGIGDIVTARLLPDDAFGKRDPDLVQEVPLEELPAGENIEVGGKITGTDEEGIEVIFSVTGIKDDIVHIDGNHPLAGQSLLFEVEIQGIRDATEDEIRSGKAAN
jgi:FKBP-type peptidyl-prolyl cis-trans isomerase SlyD